MDRNPILVRALAPDADPVRLAAANLYLRHLARLMGLSDAYVMAPDGMTVAASNFDQAFSFVGERFDYRPYFTDALAGAGRFSALGTTSGKRGITLAGRSGTGEDRRRAGAEGRHGCDRGQLARRRIRDDRDRRRGIVFLASRRDWQFRSIAPLTPRTRARIAATRRYDDEPLLMLPCAWRARPQVATSDGWSCPRRGASS
ncbi:hypothetical protein FLP41_04290 [Paracoccus marcusii]|uniref:hypothetical protein n=1 Tax=Paracoccus marcusii TaxID=59779 RepID=UPI002ED682A7|nr:hypothetical protein FLP41_04290 [Paracoccus marcusii]